MNKFDYIIAGGGLAGLSLAYRMAADPFFENKQIGLIDLNFQKIDDKTWSFWEKSSGQFDDIVIKKWDKINVFTHQNVEIKDSISPYTYKTIRSIDFYNKVLYQIKSSSAIKLIEDKILQIMPATDYIEVTCETNTYTCEYVFDSYFNPTNFQVPSSYHYLKQHFLGWEIKCESAYFEEDTATYMDMRCDQIDGLHFIYILPFDNQHALVEYTVFSENIYEKETYTTYLKNYLHEQINVPYLIYKEERGIIPMTTYSEVSKSPNHLLLGTKAAYAKASTGYAFSRTQKAVKLLVHHLKQKKQPKVSFSPIFRLMDNALLNVILSKKGQSHLIFEMLFTQNPISRILAFLNEESSFWETIKIMNSVPKALFIRKSFQEIFHMIKRKMFT